MSRAGVAEENIRRAFGDDLPAAEVDRIIRGMWEHLFRLLVEWSQLGITVLAERLGRHDELHHVEVALLHGGAGDGEVRDCWRVERSRVGAASRGHGDATVPGGT